MQTILNIVRDHVEAQVRAGKIDEIFRELNDTKVFLNETIEKWKIEEAIRKRKELKALKEGQLVKYVAKNHPILKAGMIGEIVRRAKVTRIGVDFGHLGSFNCLMRNVEVAPPGSVPEKLSHLSDKFNC